jgi:hypothetical protein
MSDFRNRHHQFGGKTAPQPKGGVKPNRDKYYKKENAKPSPVKIIDINTFIARENKGIPKGKSRKA